MWVSAPRPPASGGGRSGAVAEVAAAPFDRDDDRVGLGGRHGGLGVEDHGRAAALARPVEERQRRARVRTGRSRAETSASTWPVPTIAPRQIRRASSLLAAAIDSGAQVGSPATLRRPSRSKSISACRSGERLAAVFGADVDVALEVDRGELAVGQRLRLEAAVGTQHDVFDFDQGRAAGAPAATAAHASARRRTASQRGVAWRSEGRREAVAVVNVSFPSTCSRRRRSGR